MPKACTTPSAARSWPRRPGSRTSRRTWQPALVDEDPVTMPGAAALVRLAARHLPLAVASNCPRETVETCLERAGLLASFSHVVVACEGVRPKPEPDLYSVAVRLCGVPPEKALAVEDSLTGMESARRGASASSASGPARRVPRRSGPTCGSRASPTESWWAGPAAESGSRASWCPSKRPRSAGGGR